MLYLNVHWKIERERKVVYHQHTDGDFNRKRCEIRDVVYITKRRIREQSFMGHYRKGVER